MNLPRGRRLGALQASAAATIAVLAFDPERWIRGWIFEAAQATTVASMSLLVAIDLTLDRRDRTGTTGFLADAPVAALGSWLAWAALGPGAARSAIPYAVVGIALVRIWADAERRRADGSVAVARVLVMAFLTHLGLAAAVTSWTSIDAVVGGRLTLVSLEANELARIGAIGGVAACHLALRGATLDRLAGASIGVVAAATVALTASRTGALALAVAMTAILVLEAPRWLLGLSVAVVLAALAVVWSLELSSLPGTTALERSTDGLGSLNGRGNFWPRLLDATARDRLSGIGIGNDRAFIRAEVPTGWNAQHAHNLALHVLTTTGVVGVGLFGLAVGSSLVGAAARPAGDASATLALGLLAVVLVDGVTEAVIRTPSFGWAAVVAAAALSAPRAEPLP